MRPIDADKLVRKYIDPDLEKFDDNFGVRSVLTNLKLNVLLMPSISTKQIKYYDEDEKVWKIGEVIVDE